MEIAVSIQSFIHARKSKNRETSIEITLPTKRTFSIILPTYSAYAISVAQPFLLKFGCLISHFVYYVSMCTVNPMGAVELVRWE